MDDSSHDYSRHTEADLREQVASIDPKRFPQRSKSLMLELHRRMLVAEERSRTVHASVATAAHGARFDELDARSARRFFWPFFAFSFILLFVLNFTLGVLATVIATLIGRFDGQSPAELETTFWIVQVTVPLVAAVPVAKALLGQVTKRWFGGFGLRVVRSGPAEQRSAT